MKYIKEYSDYSNQFTTEDVQELKDVYQDIIEDLDLYDNTFQVLGINDATFQEPRKYEGKMCKIFIRTIVTEMWHFGEMKEVTKEELKYHNHVLQSLEPHITRIRNMGYVVEVKNLSTGKFNDVINGLIVVITKKPHQ